jgi:anaerobic magnesium-protoporphyrin IX monomethyl ester cyclase
MRPLRILLVDVSNVTLDTTVDMLEYPIGLLYLGTALKGAYGDRIDLRIESYEHKAGGMARLEALLSSWPPDMLGLRSLTMGRGPLHEIARLAKQRYGVRAVVAGGPHASDNPQDVLANEAFDGAAVGEGERTAVELVGRLLAGETLDGIPGLARRVNGGIALQPRTVIEDLDELPIPDYSLIDFLGINRGHVDFSFRRNVTHANLFTSRGCPYRCLYCHQVFGKRMRAHSAERVLEEVKRLHDGWGITHFQIIDDIFNLDRDRAMKFYDLVVREGLKLVISFPNGLRGDRVDDEMVDAMWDAGVRYISYAIETGSPRIQKLIQKNMNLDRIRRAIERSSAKGIVCKGYFMLGFPTETEEEALQTIQFANDSDLVLAMFFTVVYFPGTPLYKLAESLRDMSGYRLGLEDDYVRTREGPYEFSRERLDEIKRQGIREFFFSPRRVDLAFRVLPNFFPQRDIDASFLVNVISSELREEDLDPQVAARLHRYFLVADRFSHHAGFFV